MLYQTRHIRLKKETSLSIDITDLDESITSGLLKLGGEGRMASICITKSPPAFPAPPTQGIGTCKGIAIYLLTPLLLPENSAFLPDFKRIEMPEKTVWKGSLNGIQLSLISSIIGKVQREGG